MDFLRRCIIVFGSLKFGKVNGNSGNIYWVEIEKYLVEGVGKEIKTK